MNLLRYANFKFCPNCGKADVAELRKNAMRCESCGFVYFHNCASATAAIIETGKRHHFDKKSGRTKKRVL